MIHHVMILLLTRFFSAIHSINHNVFVVHGFNWMRNDDNKRTRTTDEMHTHKKVGALHQPKNLELNWWAKSDEEDVCTAQCTHRQNNLRYTWYASPSFYNENFSSQPVTTHFRLYDRPTITQKASQTTERWSCWWSSTHTHRHKNANCEKRRGRGAHRMHVTNVHHVDE